MMGLLDKSEESRVHVLATIESAGRVQYTSVVALSKIDFVKYVSEALTGEAGFNSRLTVFL